LIDELRAAAAQGFREVVLLGQTVNAYREGNVDFGALLRLCAEVDGIERIRFTSPHPADMTDSALEAMRDCAKVAPYVHLPVQSGSDAVLAAMDRGHTVAQYLDLVARMRAYVPGLALSTDIIVGYPGETERDFEATLELMERVGFDHAFMFKYSPREGTRAFKLAETVDEREKSRRLETAIEAQELRARRINSRLVGTRTEVLVEAGAKRQATWLAGKNPQFKTVVFEPTDAAVGDLVTVAVESAGPHTLRGRQIAAASPPRG
jgi:tRNA-2-methylthio-N6-dimethylallyladenosine synthase